MVYLHENFRQNSQGNVESANLIIICLLLNIFCYQQFKETSVEVLLDRYSPTPYHYTTPKVSHLLPVKSTPSPAPVKRLSRSLAPLVKAHTKLPIQVLITYPYLTAGYRNGDHCEIQVCG